MRSLWRAMGAMGLLSLFGLGAAQATNVLVVVLDDVGADKVGAYRSEVYGSSTPTFLPDTPTLDGLATVGLRFSNTWASPVCSPTRAGLLTGRFPYQTDVGTTVREETPELPAAETTLAEVLGSSSWTSSAPEVGLFGKWHLGTSSAGGTDWSTAGSYEDLPNPIGHGFDQFAGMLGGEPDDYFAWTGVTAPVQQADGSDGATVEDRDTYAGEDTIEDAVDWIAGRSRPWVAVVSLTAAHTDTAGGNRYYEDDDMPPGWSCQDTDGDGECTQPELYGTLVEYADAQVEALLTDLRTRSPALLDDVLVVVVADNGTPEPALEGALLAGGERTDAGKTTVWESGVRVPLLMARGCDWLDAADGRFDGKLRGSRPACAASSLSRTTAGLVVTAPTSVQDLFATVLSAAGSTYTPPASSVNLLPCFSATSSSASTCGLSALTNRTLYTEAFTRPWSQASGWGTTGVANQGRLALKRGTYKLTAEIEGTGSSRCLRYRFLDLATDPYETDDLLAGGSTLSYAQSAGYARLKATLLTTLRPDWLPSATCS